MKNSVFHYDEIKKHRKDLLIIFLTALLFRSFFLLHPYDGGDSYEYRKYAENLIKYRTFSYSEELPMVPSTHRTPIYPLFVALIYCIFGAKDIFVYIAQVIISSATCLLIYFIALDLFNNRRIIFWIGIVVALHPFLSWFVSTIMTEILFTFLISITLLFLLRAIKFNSNRLFFLAGALLGVSALCRPTAKFMFLWIIFILMLVYKNKKLFLRYGILFFLGFILSVLPWSLRHYIVTKQFIFITSQGSENLYIATLPSDIFDDVTQNNFSLGGQRDPLFRELLLSVHNDPKFSQIKKEMRKKAILNIKEHPFTFMLNRIRCQFFLWIGSNYMIETTFSEAISKRLYGALLIKLIITFFLHILPVSMYLFAGWLLRMDWRKYLLVYSIPVYFAVLHFSIHIEMRYSLPAYPYILIFSTYAILNLLQRAKNRFVSGLIC